MGPSDKLRLGWLGLAGSRNVPVSVTQHNEKKPIHFGVST